MKLDPESDLEITRLIPAPRDRVWACWSDPERLRKWWAPKPIMVDSLGFEFRTGGDFSVTMKAPDGTLYPGSGCFLEIEEKSRIVFTDAVSAGWRPAAAPFMSAIITFADEDGGTRYTAHVLHPTAEARKRHEEMGFADGWGTCIGQLADLAQSI